MRRGVFFSTTYDVASPSWVEEAFQKTECMQFVQDPHDVNKCGCGRDKSDHDPMQNWTVGQWSWKKHSISFPTDAYGALEFPTGVHAHYLRMSPSAKVDDVVRLLTDQWGADPPKLIVSIHGGISNFDLMPRLKRAFRKSLQRMAAVPGCWIITSGLNSGVAKHVGDVLTAGFLRRSRAVVLGIAPWGVVAGRNRLIVRNGDVQYYPPATAPGSTVLNPNHSFFLLVDDGSAGKYGTDVKWRHEFEMQISSQNRESSQISNVPLVAVFLEGGAHCIRIAADYLTTEPDKPIVLVADSGRACDILTMAINLVEAGNSDKSTPGPNNLSESDLAILSASIQQVFSTSQSRNKAILNEVMLCTKRRKLITVWSVPDSVVSPNSETDELDVCILSTLLKAKKRSAPEQLRLALAWNRVDLANSLIFTEGQHWPEGALQESMMEALAMDRVEFVKLLLHQGVDMYEVLTYQRLEALYNIKHSDAWQLRDIIRLLLEKQIVGRLNLGDAGATIDALMGFGYRSSYKTRAKLIQDKKKSDPLGGLSERRPSIAIPGGNAERFRYPFSELLVWAVLMQRQGMARLMCTQGEEMLAKCLVACRLYRSLAIFLQTDVTPEIITQMKQNSKEFSNLAVDLLDRCHRHDDVMAQRLLTYELCNFSEKTCLSLAVSAKAKHLVAHPCCQNLLEVLWMGGLRTRSTRPWKILLGLLLPPYALFGLDYLSQEELTLQPQTEAEIEQRLLHESGNRSASGELSPTNNMNDDPVLGGAKLSHAGGSESYKTMADRPRMGTYGAVKPNGSTVGANVRNRSESGAKLHHQPSDLHIIQVPPMKPRTESTPLPYHLPTIQSTASFGSFLPPTSTVVKRSRLSIMADLNAKVGGTPLSIKTRFDEFYNAPVTKYWLHSIAYFVFVLCFCFTILTESFLDHVLWPEVYICCYVVTLLIDKIREIVSIDARGLKARLEIYFSDMWNIFDATAVCLFLIGLMMRWEQDTFEAGRAFWIVAIIFFLIHIFDVLQASQDVASYIMILTKMLKRMFSFLLILGVVVLTYGIVLQATRFPYRKPEWDILKDVWVEPYLNLYGEVYHEFVDTEQCDSESKYSLDREKPPCWCCTWIGPLAQAVFLIIANVTMLNLLVAVFNSVYEKVNRVSQAMTRFQRYRFIVDYQLLPTLPPPFIIFSHIYILMRALIRRCRGYHFRLRDPGLLKVVLSDADVAGVHDFEEQACDELLEQNEIATAKPSADEQLRTATERMEAVQSAVEQIVQRQAAVLNAMRDFEIRMMARTISSSFPGNDIPQPATAPPTQSPHEAMKRLMSTSTSPQAPKPNFEQVEAEESSRSALGPGLFRHLRETSITEEDKELSQAARDLLSAHDGSPNRSGAVTPALPQQGHFSLDESKSMESEPPNEGNGQF